MKNKLLFALFISFVSYNLCNAQTFQKRYGTPGLDILNTVFETHDSSFIIGYTMQKDGGTHDYDLGLIKTDRNGDTLWTKIYGEIHDEQMQSAQETVDHGIIMTGWAKNGNNLIDFYLAKTDSDGNLLWSKAYGGGDWDQAYSVQETVDSGFIITGTTRSFSNGLYLIKTDKDGNLQWTKVFQGFFGNDVRQCRDGGFIIGGGGNSNGSVGANLLKTDQNGNLLWSKIYSLYTHEIIYSVRECADAGFIMTGITYTALGAPDIALLIKADSIGNIQWSKSYSNGQSMEGTCIQLTSDGGYIIGGMGLSLLNSHPVTLLLKTDATGTISWSRGIGNVYITGSLFVSNCSDGKYIVGSQIVTDTITNNKDILITKTDSLGLIGCNEVFLTITENSIPLVTGNVMPVILTGGIETTMITPQWGGSYFSNACEPTGIPTNTFKDDPILFPNPSNGIFSIHLPEGFKTGNDFKLSVYDTFGKLILNKNQNKTDQLILDLSKQAKGLYLVNINAGHINYSEKVAVE